MAKPITVPVDLGDRSYKIHIGEGVLDKAMEFLPFDLKGRKVFILHDKNVASHAERLATSLKADGIKFLAVEGGEQAKSFGQLQIVTDWLLSNNVDRKSALFVVGGGVIGDLGGFAASVTMRGIPFVQVPTTLLAQVDSSVGGKTGINAVQGKNLIGAFYQPVAVLCDVSTLKTLPERELKAGYAEVVKYGLLGSAEFYNWLEANAEKILSLEPAPLMDAIETSCRMKAEIVGDDEREQAGGDRALLNLGHTFGHALEATAGYDGRLLHGEAVSIGMVLAFRLCVRMGICAGQDADRMERHLKACGLKTEIAQISPKLTQNAREITELMYHDKKASGGKIGFILVREIGNAFQSPDVDMNEVESVVRTSMQ
ncbi:MAG: 3-dehydroquinate synthase [Micavibrio aeruginosavorus]|uniref:3-dehydroquinate synthase n=1 Tax=Micavibrio aeruginosavorus TaxID=349221 RepID=A0A2W5N0E6_9BACT|nr:MAG: 3-dehydroquinate synthase [Micavibrio aeruginosavorus]